MTTTPAPSRSDRTHHAGRLAAGAITAVLLGLGAAACGGAPSGTGTTSDGNHAPGASGRQLAILGAAVTHAKAVGQAAKRVAPAAAASPDPVSTRPTAVRGRSPGPSEDESTAAGQTTGACRLVTANEAARIVGRPIAKVTEASQGPTCIYQPRHTKAAITLTIEAVPFSSIRKNARILARRRVAGHTVYCVRYGRVMTFAPLSSRRVLNVTSSCTVGRRFAAKALPRVR